MEVLLLIPTHFTQGAGYTVNNAKMSSILILSTLFHYSSTSFSCKSFSAWGGLKFSPNYPKLTVSSGCRNYYSSTGESHVLRYWDKCGRKLVLKVIEQIFRFESNPHPCFMPCLLMTFSFSSGTDKMTAPLLSPPTNLLLTWLRLQPVKQPSEHNVRHIGVYSSDKSWSQRWYVDLAWYVWSIV